MKITKPILLFICLSLFTLGQAQVSKTVNNTAGALAGLFTPAEKKTINNLKVTGTLNKSDFFYMRDSLSVIQILDLSEARITSPLDTVPDQAFFKKSTLRKISFPTNIVRIGSTAFYNCTGLLSVEIPATVTSIGASAFSGCGVKSVILPPTKISYYGPAFFGCDSLVIATTPCSNDGGDIFSGCNNLRTIIVPEGVTTIKDGAFYQLGSMTKITLPSTLTSIGTHAFYNCINLDSIAIPEGVTSIGRGAFWQNMKLKSVKIPNSLTTLEDDAFSSCSLLTSLVFPKGLTTIKSGVFGGCSGLTTITIPYGNDISNGSNIFVGCTKLKTIIIPDGLTSIKNYAFNAFPANVTTFKIPASVKSIGDRAFANCTGIESISIPDSVSTIGAYAFSGCSGLKSVIIPNAVTNLGIYSFQNCSNLSALTLPTALSGINEGVFSGCSKLISVNFPESLVSLGKSAFSGCTALVLSTIPSAINSIGESCFSACVGLKSIAIPSSVSVINNSVFSGCTGLASVQLPTSIKSIGNQAFSGCNALTSISIPANTNINYNAFQNCKGLVTATTPYTYNSGNVFEGCLHLKTIVIPSGMSSIKDYAFYHCNSVDSIYIPNSVYTIGNSAFYGCSNLKKLSLPTYLYTIKDYAFAYCSSLNSISLPATLSGIPNFCFSRCTSLSSITIPGLVSTIGSYAFDGCTGLNSIYIENSFPVDLTKYTAVFNNVNKTSCILNVPYGTKARYVTANQWSEFTNIVENSTGFFISSNKVELTYHPGSTSSIDVKANVAWTASSNRTWLTVTPASGTGDNTLTFTSDNTQITTIRNAVVTLSAPGSVSQTVTVIQKLAPKTVSISAGGLSTALTADELNSLSTLTVTGTMDARDFKVLCDSMPHLADLDLSGASIAAYAGVTGTYPANTIPMNAFYNSSARYGNTNLKNIKLPLTISSIGANAFGDCSGLITVSIPSSVTSINGNAFYNCTGLKSITIPASVSFIGSYAFYNCRGLTSIIVNSSYPIDLTNTSLVFYDIDKTNCSLHVPYGSKSLYAASTQWKEFTKIVENPTGFLLSTNKLKIRYNAGSSVNIDIKSNVAWTVSSDQPWLTVNTGSGSGNTMLTLIAEDNLTANPRKGIITVSAPDCISQIVEVTQNIAPKTIDITAGELYTALTPDELSSLSALTLTGTLDARDFKTMRDKMPLLTDLDFTGASILAYTGTEGTYPFSISTVYPANTIPQYAFSGKIILQSAVIPSTVVAIGEFAFQNCSGLSSFSIPSTVNSLGGYAFYGCRGLASIYSNSSYPIDLNRSYNVFFNVNNTTCTLYVPYKAKALYAADYQWNAFKNIVENTQGFIAGSNKIKLAYGKGSTGSIDVSANVGWTAASDQSWVTVNPASGSGDGKLTFVVEQNDSTSRRFANITLSSAGYGSQIITVTQTGSPKTINITAGNLSTSLSAEELNSIVDLNITGTMDARDFKTLRDEMPELARLDISKVTIVAFNGEGGTYDFNAGYSANAIPPSAFYIYSPEWSKTSLISIKLPSSITYIGYSAFQGCTGLTSIYLNSSYPIDLTNSDDPFYKMNKAGCTLYVPYATSSLYKNTDKWNSFVNIIENTHGFLVGQRTVKFNSSLKSKSVVLKIKTNVAWLAQSDQPWLIVSPDISSNDSVLTLTAEANLSDTIRKATIIISSPGFNSQKVDITQAAAPRKVTAGGLSSILTSTELSTITDIALMGTVDARDFKTIRDNMPALANLDLSAVNIVAYQGNDGTSRSSLYNNYSDNEIPREAFSYYIKTVILPETTVSIGSHAFDNAGNLTSIELPLQLSLIKDRAFLNCVKLQLISLPDSLISIGDAAFYGCNGIQGQLTLPLKLKKIGASAFQGCTGLTGGLTIPASVDSIGGSAFNNCYGLSSLVINLANPIIGASAFSSCSGLKSIIFPPTLTSIGEDAFGYCLNLKTISLPPSLKTIGSKAFQVCMGLTSIEFPASLTTIGDYAFTNSGLINITIPATLTNIGGYAFSACKSLTNVLVPSNLKTIPNGMFSGCSNLGSFEFLSGLEAIGENAFSGCTSLVNVNLPPLISTIKANTFSGCSGLKSVNFPSSLTSIDYNSFSFCTELTSLNIPASVKSIGYAAFSGCSKLTAVILPPALLSIEGKLFENCTNLASVTIPSSVRSIGDYAFSNCVSLTSFTVPSSVESLGEESFYNCIGLNDIELAVGLKSIGSKAFSNCRKLTRIVMPASLKTIGGYAFAKCESLTAVTLNENLETIGYYCFSDCINLSNINLPNTLKNIGGYCFLNCYSLRSIVIPPLITEIGSFSNCKNLTSVTLNSGLKSVSGFSGCGFSTITLPNSLTSIGYMAFSACNNLTSIEIPPNVKMIDNSAFNSCASLNSVKIPASVNEIDVGAFGSCKALSTVYSYSITPVDMSFAGDGFWGVNKTTCILYVPMGSMKAYQNAIYWKDFANIVEMPTAVPSLLDEKINIYQDPVTGSFRIHGIDGLITVSIYDLNGKALLHKQVQANENISVSNFPKGIYIIRVSTNEGTMERKILKG